MTNEEKQLLLKDLCARLPYGVKISYVKNTPIGLRRRVGTLQFIDTRINHIEMLLSVDGGFEYANGLGISKPYLRPMSSMTDEEWTEYEDMCDSFRGEEFYELIDWLNEKHFDYRGLIEKELALEAPEGMYKNE